MPSATLSRQNHGRWKPFYISTGRADKNTSPSPPKIPCLRFTNCLVFVSGNTSSSSPEMPCLRFTKYLAFVLENTPPSGMPRLHITKFPLSKGKSLVSGGGAFTFQRGPVHSFICGGSHSLVSVAGAFFHLRRESFSFQRGRGILSSAAGAFSFQRGRCILSSAVPEHLLSRQLRPLEGKTHVHRARYCSHFAAVGSLSMPSATLSRQNRGRWKPFYMSTGRAHENTSSSSPELPCLRFTNCLVFVSGNVPLPQDYSSSKAFLMTSTESRSSHPKNWTFSSVFFPWMFISMLAR